MTVSARLKLHAVLADTARTMSRDSAFRSRLESDSRAALVHLRGCGVNLPSSLEEVRLLRDSPDTRNVVLVADPNVELDSASLADAAGGLFGGKTPVSSASTIPSTLSSLSSINDP